ncbi:hypothetical protein L0Y59_00560 [Candidatus Uhrbacteria bacterium]|nr:hypothetical protein [Candidatus Uhrbacteria bacterium]
MSPKFERNAARKTEARQDAPTKKRIVPSGRPSSPIPLERRRKDEVVETEAQVIDIRKRLRGRRDVPTIPPDEVPRDEVDVDLSDLEPAPETDVDLSDLDADLAAEERARKATLEQLETNDMTVAKAQRLIPKAAGLWERVNEKVTKDPVAHSIVSAEAKHFFMPEAKTGTTPDPATTYVFTLARYKEALHSKDRDAAERYRDKAVRMSKALGLMPPDEERRSPEEVDVDLSDLTGEADDGSVDVDVTEFEGKQEASGTRKKRVVGEGLDFGEEDTDVGRTYTATFSKPPTEALEQTERFLERQVTKERARKLLPAYDAFVQLARERTEGHPGVSMYLAEEAQRYTPRPDPSEALAFAVANVIATREHGDIDAANREEARVRELARTIRLAGNPLFEAAMAPRTINTGMESVRRRQADVKHREQRWNPNAA